MNFSTMQPTPPSTACSSITSQRQTPPVVGTLRSPRPPRSAASTRLARTHTTNPSSRESTPRRSSAPASTRRRVPTIPASERGLLRRKENERHRTNAINALGYNIRNELKPSRRQPAASAGSFLANELKFQALDLREQLQAKKIEEMTRDCGIDKHERSAMYNAWEAILGRRPAVQRSPWRGDPFCGMRNPVRPNPNPNPNPSPNPHPNPNPVSVYPLDVAETNKLNRDNTLMQFEKGVTERDVEDDDHEGSLTPHCSPSEVASGDSPSRDQSEPKPSIAKFSSPRVRKLVMDHHREYEQTQRQIRDAVDKRNAWDYAKYDETRAALERTARARRLPPPRRN